MASRRRTKRGRGKTPSLFYLALSFLAGAALASLLFFLISEKRPPSKPVSAPAPKEEVPAVPSEKPLFRPPPPVIKGPCVAIIIDDIGYRRSDVVRFASIPYPIALSIIPFTPFDTYSARYAHSKGKDVMLHVPMQPNHTSEAIERLERRTKGMLLERMSSTQIVELLRRELARVPYAVAVNNHMGSRFTQNTEKVAVVLRFLYGHSLFFVDSVTTPHSAVCRVAKDSGLVALKRDVFLDNSKSVNYIKRQLEELGRIALKKGYAIAIGHPHVSTYRALVEMLPRLESEGVKVVSVKDIYRAVLEGEYEGCL